MIRTRQVATFFLLIFFASIVCAAQTTTSTLEGNAVDSSGASTAGVSVEAQREHRGPHRGYRCRRILSCHCSPSRTIRYYRLPEGLPNPGFERNHNYDLTGPSFCTTANERVYISVVFFLS